MSGPPIISADDIDERARVSADASARLLTRAALPVVVLDTELIVRGWNAAAERELGHTAEHAVGRSIADLFVEGEAGWRAALESPSEVATFVCTRESGPPVTCAWTFEATADEPTRWLCAAQVVPRPTLDTRVLGAILDNLPISVWAVERHGDYVFHDGLGVEQVGVERGAFVGQNMWEMWKGIEGTAETLRQVKVAMESNETTHAYAEAMGHTWESWCVPLSGDEGEVDLVVSTTMDITPHRKAENELRERLEQIEQQQQLIRQLTTPIIEVWDGVLTMPLVGAVDGERATQMMERLLEQVARMQAKFTIIDLTGVEDVETLTASYLISLVRALGLLGTEAIVTGVRPSVAQTLASLGGNLSMITMRSNLRSGLQYCMQKIAAKA